MDTLWWTLGTAVAVVWVWCVGGLVLHRRDVVFLDRLEWDRTLQAAPRVSVIVPAKDEAQGVEAALRSLLAQDYPELEIIAVNDRSADASGSIMERVAAESGGRLRVLHVTELPPHWVGKTHAMWLGANSASGELLLFTDGDVVFAPSALRRAVAFAEQERADHTVVYPTLVMRSVGERIMLSFFHAMFMFGNRAWKVSDPNARDFIGVGAFNMLRRSAYQALGTWEALRMSIVEDLDLGRRVKELRLRQRAAVGPGLVKVDWVRGALGAVRNLSKNFFAALKYRWDFAIGAAAAMLVVNLAPFLGTLLAPGWRRLPFAVSLAAVFLLYCGIAMVTRISPAYVLLHPVAAVLFAYAMLRSAAITALRGGVTWRDTFYPLAELRRMGR